MISILALCPNFTDTTSWYRAAGPFANLRKRMDIRVEYADKFFWVNMKQADIFFMQRPMLKIHQDVAQMAKDCGIPLWVEFDDDLFNVPVENQYHAMFAEKQTREIMKSCIEMADVVTVASDRLKVNFEQLNKNIVVIPNAFDEMWIKNYDPTEKRKDPNKIMWRGSDTHIKDIMSVQKEIREVAIEFPNLIWHFVGYLPWFLVDAPEMRGKIEYTKTMDPVQYFTFLKQSTASIGIVPLVENGLNLCKSNIAWQEMTLAGAAVLAPEMPEWKKPGVTLYKRSLGFKERLINMVESSIDKEACLETSLSYIMENLTLTKVNKLRKEVIEKLLSN